MNPILALGNKRDLELEDLYEPQEEDRSEVGEILSIGNMSQFLFKS